MSDTNKSELRHDYDQALVEHTKSGTVDEFHEEIYNDPKTPLWHKKEIAEQQLKLGKLTLDEFNEIIKPSEIADSREYRAWIVNHKVRPDHYGSSSVPDEELKKLHKEGKFIQGGDATKRRTGKRRTGKRRTGKRRTGKRRTGKRRTGKRRNQRR